MLYLRAQKWGSLDFEGYQLAQQFGRVCCQGVLTGDSFKADHEKHILALRDPTYTGQPSPQLPPHPQSESSYNR